MEPLPGAGSHAHRDHRPYPTQQTLTKYRLTREGWASLWDFQQGRCPLCTQARTLVIDHDHKTGLVRGLLCNLCNGRLGKVRDDVGWLLRAASYLQHPPAQQLDIQATARTLKTGRRTRRPRR